MNQYEIRKMDISDVRFVHQSEKETFGKSFGEKMYYDEVLYNTLAHYYLLVIAGKRRGYIGFWITEPNAEITTIYVDQESRRNGYGSILLHHAIAICKEHSVDDLTLEVRKTNESAIAFYHKHGFDQVSIRKNYYQNGDDALLMRLSMGGTR